VFLKAVALFAAAFVDGFFQESIQQRLNRSTKTQQKLFIKDCLIKHNNNTPGGANFLTGAMS